MKILVFGGCGFLGSYIANELVKQNHSVTVVDIQKKYFNSKCFFKRCDITNSDEVKSVFDETVDIVFNFAAVADLNISINEPLNTMKVNVMGNLNLLEACRVNKIKHFIYASSVYACSEKASFYGISKYSAEKIVEEYQKYYGLNYTILRYGSIYGPHADSSNGMFNFLKQALTGKILHHGTGEEVREYIHARDAAMLSAGIVNEKKYFNKIFVLTGVEPIRQSELFKMIKEILGDKLEIKYDNQDYRGHYKYTPYSFSPSVASKLSPNPFTDLGQGIVECLEELTRR
jgi:UDP-glucose 4-epimerase